MQDFRNLRVWQVARLAAQTAYALSADFPRAEEFGLKAQMRRAAVSICCNIAEGCGRRGDREFRRFVDVAMGSACELECEAILAVDLGLLTKPAGDELVKHVVDVKRMLSVLAQRL